MQTRKFDELISYFNRKVADMDIDTNYKMELLGMVTALGYAHEKETEERKKGKWIEHNPHKWGLGIVFECSECGEKIDCEPSNFCPNCGAEMTEDK